MPKVRRNFRGRADLDFLRRADSLFVSGGKGIFKDFSSGKGGDGISFVMEMEGISYPDALIYLAKKYGIEVKEEEPTGEELQKQSDRESILIVLNYANQYFIKNLWETDEGRSIGLSYFRERGLSEDIIKKFELGYSFDKWDGLIQSAEAKNYNKEFLEKAGLILSKENKTYDRFRGRVMFPIHNLTGKAVAFVRIQQKCRYFGGFAEADRQHASSQRIQAACMPGLGSFEQVFHLLQHLVRTEARRFIQ